MNNKKIRGNYDAVFSLGNQCLGALQMKKFNLRPFSGVLDWVGSHTLPHVCELLQNRFDGFMELDNLQVIGHATPTDFLVLDNRYSIYFNHDFKTAENTETHLAAYAEVKEKYERRITLFLDKMATSKRILFIRTEGSLEEITELESVLSKLVANDFRILVVNHTDVENIMEKKWSLKKVYAVELPNKEIWNDNDHYWEKILNGVNLKEK